MGGGVIFETNCKTSEDLPGKGDFIDYACTLLYKILKYQDSIHTLHIIINTLHIIVTSLLIVYQGIKSYVIMWI